MKLRSQIINHLKQNGPVLGVEMQRKEFITPKGGLYSPAYIDRELRSLAEEGRLTRRHPDGLVEFAYKSSSYEKFHQTMI